MLSTQYDQSMSFIPTYGHHIYIYVYKFITVTMYSYVVMQSCTSTIGKEHVIAFKGLTKESMLFVCWNGFSLS